VAGSVHIAAGARKQEYGDLMEDRLQQGFRQIGKRHGGTYQRADYPSIGLFSFTSKEILRSTHPLEQSGGFVFLL
jgi:hypothetical protein